MKQLFVEKKTAHRSHATSLLQNLRAQLHLTELEDLRVIQRYQIIDLSEEHFTAASQLILSEPQVDDHSTTLPIPEGYQTFAVQYLPGQFDQRADSAAQAIQILTGGQRPTITSAQIYFIKGSLTDSDLTKIKNYLINPVDSHQIPLDLDTTQSTITPPQDVPLINDFTTATPEQLHSLRDDLGLAMSFADLAHTQCYFRDEENRDPSLTEIKMLDTYWSDHCRHTTFLTKIDNVTFDEGTDIIEQTYHTYLETRQQVYGTDTDRPITLMDIALMGMKELRKTGELDNVEVSNEINAASIEVDIEIDRELDLRSHPSEPSTTNSRETTTERWLIQFKNETHNHPTEIEPYGGAATCLGGCIRDPLSGRSYVYQAMRVTGAADPRTPFSETIPGKLPQRKICREAAHGYSSYGNQIGLATGKVSEVYHPGYAAKRLEIGAVVAAAPKKNVFRGDPATGDFILLIGGRTGRDGVGGATGSSKEHTDTALENSAEVQKGDPPMERRIQRLFRHPELAPKIKICNDFGAGGVSVAIGEIADSLDINLDKVPKKYDGLDGTELAISESQERMAVCVDPTDAPYFTQEADKENLECTHVATVTDTGRLRITWRGQDIVNLSREFLETNGVQQSANIRVNTPQKTTAPSPTGDSATQLHNTLADLNHCSQKGLGEMFDSSIGAATVLSPFGGKNQLTPPDAMVAKVPLLEGETDACTHMAWGFDPYLSEKSPFHGAAHAVTESVCKALASGAKLTDIRLTLQEYFPKIGGDENRWGLPFASLLGAFHAQHGLRLGAIGGKDSMSGTFNDLDVPPTLVSFALAPGLATQAISPEFKQAGSTISIVHIPLDHDNLPDYLTLKTTAAELHTLIASGTILSAKHIGQPGLAHALATSAFGNDIGFAEDASNLFPYHHPLPTSFIVEHTAELSETFQKIGTTTEDPSLTINGKNLNLQDLKTTWENTLEDIYPTTSATSATSTTTDHGKLEASSREAATRHCKLPTANSKPSVLIPVFPGTNCEYDTARVFQQAGASPDTFIFRNLTANHIEDSLKNLAQKITQSQILMIPGGFSAGDEPDGSAKFIATVLRNPRIADAIMDLIKNRDGLILGICNGFQALVKTGLLPHGHIIASSNSSADDVALEATLTYNSIPRHISTYVTTRVASTLSPWLSHMAMGDLHTIPVSHGEGRFIAPEHVLSQLADNGQIAFQYADPQGKPTMTEPFNPNGSDHAIEGISSPCGRILGKMGHTERRGTHIAKNIPGNKHQPLFKAGVEYFL